MKIKISVPLFIRYEACQWLTGFVVKRIVATYIHPYSTMANYESSKDIFLGINKAFWMIVSVILESRESKEYGNSHPTNNSKQKLKEEDGNPHIR